MATLNYKGVAYTAPFVDVMPPLTAEERAELKVDIATNGVAYDVLVSEDDEILDGHNRLSIAIELGLTNVPIKVMHDLTPEQKRERAADLNLHRRHLTREQRRAIIASRLRADPARSNNSIAADVRADDKTVAAVRRNLEATSEIPKLAATRGRDGKTRKAKPARPAAVARDAAPPASASFAGWSSLGMIAFRCGLMAQELNRVRKTRIADRSAAPVLDVATKLRLLVADLEAILTEGRQGA